MTDRVPNEVVEAAVTVCGTAFYYKSRLESLFVGAGVPDSMYRRHEVEGASKYTIARGVFTDLQSKGSQGIQVLRTIVEELAGLRQPDQNASDRTAGARAIRDLRAISTTTRVLVDVEAAARQERSKRVASAADARTRRSTELARIAGALGQLHKSSGTPQARGYALEGLLADLCAAYEVTYRRSYRTDHEQIDGAIEYRGFTYLIEARWRSAFPNLGDLAEFKRKVDGKMESTRGIFVSINGFDTEVVEYFMQSARGTRNNLILMDGQDLSLICENNPSLSDALDYKIAKASQEGIFLAPLSQRIV